MYEWRIRETPNGHFMAEYGTYHDGKALSPNGIGYIMKTFFITKSSRFETKEMARQYIQYQKAKAE